jgi:hypothetical protein
MEAGEAAAAVLFDEGVDEIFGDAAEAESAEHEGGAGGNVGDGGFGGGKDFVHVVSGLGVTEQDSGWGGAWERGTGGGVLGGPATKVKNSRSRIGTREVETVIIPEMAQAIPDGSTFVLLVLIRGLNCGQLRYSLLAVG